MESDLLMKGVIFLNEIKEEIYNKLKSKYEELFKKDFKIFFKTTILEMDTDLEIKALLSKVIRPTKKRWIKMITNNKESSFNKNLELVRLSIEKANGDDEEISKILGLLGVKSIEEYEKSEFNKLQKWVNDDNKLLSEFVHLSELRNKSILSAFRNDITLSYLINLESTEEPQTINKVSVTKVPAIFSQIPIDVTGKIDYLTTDQKKSLDCENDSVLTLDKLISLEGNEQEEILMKLEKKTYLEIKNGGNPDNYLDTMTQIALLKSIKYLNSFDTKIVNYYYNHFEHVVTGTPIDKSLYEITMELNMPNTSAYTEYVENSLAKLGSMNMTYNIEGNKLYGNLLSCMIYTKNGVKRAKVFLGAILQNLVIKDSAFEYDKDIYNNLSDASKQLAVWLQKRRYNLALNKTSQTRTEEIELVEFSNTIYFKTKRADRRRNTILKSLEELKTRKLIVTDFNYTKKSNTITIEYVALTIREKNKLGILDHDLIKDNMNEINSKI